MHRLSAFVDEIQRPYQTPFRTDSSAAPPLDDPTTHELEEQVRDLRAKLANRPSAEVFQAFPGVWATKHDIGTVFYTNLLTGERQTDAPKVRLLLVLLQMMQTCSPPPTLFLRECSGTKTLCQVL
jgi:hypothetical protein